MRTERGCGGWTPHDNNTRNSTQTQTRFRDAVTHPAPCQGCPRFQGFIAATVMAGARRMSEVAVGRLRGCFLRQISAKCAVKRCSMRRLALLVALTVLTVVAAPLAQTSTWRPVVLSDTGMIASGHELASEAGIRILKS